MVGNRAASAGGRFPGPALRSGTVRRQRPGRTLTGRAAQASAAPAGVQSCFSGGRPGAFAGRAARRESPVGQAFGGPNPPRPRNAWLAVLNK